MSGELENLAARVEALSGPDREVDALIHFLMNAKWVGRIPSWPPTKVCRPAMERGLSMHIEGDGYFYGDEVPPYTTSIDAAMTLVPDGNDVQVHLYFGREGEGAAIVSPLKRINLPRVFAATPALALCVAALRARSASMTPSPDRINKEGL